MPVEEIPINEKRKAVLIGKDGGTKRMLEKKTKTTLHITDYVRVEGPVEGLLKAQDVVRAISRGFSPKQAFRLLNEETRLDIISLNDESENTRKRLLARIIGRSGSSKRVIEKESGASISVYGKTVAIIGKPGQLDAARHAVEALLDGKTHGYAYSRMEKE